MGTLAYAGWGALDSILVVFGVLVAIAELNQVTLWPGQGISLGNSLALTVGYLHGMTAALTQALGGLMVGLARRSPLRILLGNVSIFAISAAAAAGWMRFLAQQGAHTALSLVAGSGLSLLVNSLLVTGAMTVGRQGQFLQTWLEVNRASALPHLLSLGLALVLVAAHRMGGMPYVVGLCLLGVAAGRAVLPAYARWSRARAVRNLLQSAREVAGDRQGHCQRVFKYACAIGSQARLSRRDQERLGYAALLHEIGLTPAVADLIAQPRRLTADELARVRETTVRGAAMVASVAALKDVAEVVLHHSERPDGHGYPSGLTGDGIPLPARVLSVANAFDALTSTRPHRPRFAVEQAMAELETQRGSQFCPLVVAACRQAISRPGSGLLEADGSPVVAEAVLDRLQRYVGDQSDERRRRAGDVFGLFMQLFPSAHGAAALLEMAQVLGKGLDLEETQVLACRTAARISGQAAALLLADADGSRLEVRVTHGVSWDMLDLEGRSFDARSGLLGLALQDGRPVTSADAAADRRSGRPNPFAPLGVRSLTIIPFPNRGRIAGALLLWDRRIGILRAPVRRTLAVLGLQTALALDNARLLQEARERLAEMMAVRNLSDLVLTNVPTGVLAVDREGTIRVINPEAERILSDLDLRPGASLEHLTGDYRHLAAMLAEAVTPAWEPSTVTLRVVDRRAERVLEVMCAPLIDQEGGGTGGVALFRDVTERARLEAQLLHAERLALAGEVAAGAAHEIRNPITCVRGLVQMLMVPGTPPDVAQRYLGVILAEVDRVEGITRDLLQMSRSPRAAVAPVDLNALLEEVCLVFTAETAIRQVAVSCRLQADLPAANVNAAQFRQVFMNILRNALEAVGSGGRIDIATEYLPSRKSVAVTIADDGPGVPPEIRDRLFEPFFSTRPDGTGLGLAVSHSIVRSHGGEIVVDSHPGQGAVFRVLIPVRPRSAAEVKQSRS
jgi:PAS domain S-box-containing protein